MATQTSTTLTNSERPIVAYGSILVLLIALALASPFVRLAQGEGTPSMLIAVLRFFIASAVLLPFVIRGGHFKAYRSMSLGEIGFVILAGVFLALELLLWTYSLELTTILVSTTLLNTNMLWAALFETTVLREKLKHTTLIGMLIAFSAGVFLVISGGMFITNAPRPVLGNIIAAISAVALAAYLIVGRRQRGTMPLLPYIWLVYTAAALIGGVVLLATQTPVIGYTAPAYFWLFMVALVSQIIGHSSINLAVRYFSATYVGVAQQLIPGISAFLGFILLAERPSLPQIIASVVVLSGVLIATLGQRQAS